MWTMRQAQAMIVIAGCLGMAYTQLTTCSASIEFVRNLGGTGFHVGILGALPTGMLFVQFFAAWLGNKLTYRRPWWFWGSIIQRLLCIPAAMGPLLFPEIPDVYWLWAVLISWGMTQGLVHFTNPLWLSWMGDYLPKKGLSHYWGVRHYWMQGTAALSLVLASLYLRYVATDIREGFAWIVLVGCVLGIIDILLFHKVDEPKVTRLPEAGLKEVLSGPFRHPGFRSFIGFTCFWHFAAMIGAPFISLYLLDHVGMSADAVLMLWTFSWIGGALSSKWLGRLTETHGNRVVLILCTTLKPMNMLSLLMVPRDPTLAFWFLAPLFMIDMGLNTGIAIANNGFLLKNSPAANRTMYIAAGTAVAGLVGGVTSVLCGVWLTWMGDWTTVVFGAAITGYHVLFLFSTLMRFVSIGLVHWIHEPEGPRVREVVTLLLGIDPIRVLRYPMGLYQRWTETELIGEPEGAIPDSASTRPGTEEGVRAETVPARATSSVA